VVVTKPGVLVNIQFPFGNPFSTTLPVDEVQVGCVIDPTTGAPGVDGCSVITILLEAADIHPDALVTV
jgi:hypothetical protein